MSKWRNIQLALDSLTSIKPGEIWTEYHWRTAEQLKVDVTELKWELDVANEDPDR